MHLGGPRHHWPLGKGFERFYGFLAGETDQYRPDLIDDNHQVRPPRSPEQGYHLTEDLADRAIGYLKDLRAYSTDKPFLLYVAPGACHAPHQAPASFIEPYRGRFDQGWDAWRDQVFARQTASGLLPAGTELSERPSWVPAWSTLSDDQRRLYARMMEVYAGFLSHTDAQVARIVDFVQQIGELENTIVLVMSDNGASAEGGPQGSVNEQYFFNFVPESMAENLARIDELGTPSANNHYPWGWAWAGNTPLKRFKRDTHEGGVCDPLIVHWPSRLGRPGDTRGQYVHAIDVMPTLLELIGIDAPSEIAGVAQRPLDGTSFVSALEHGEAPATHVTQYYEMLGSRALYHDGWKAVVFHPPALMAYDGTDAGRRSFDDDIWELYHVAEDFSECHDVAAQNPGKLAELQAMWWEEAERNQVLPLNNQPGRYGDRRFRRDRYVYHPGISSIPETMAPNLRNRAFQILGVVRISSDGPCDGVIVGHGGHSGGYALYLLDRRLHYVNNLLGSQVTTVSAEVEVPAGEVLVRATFTPTGRFQGDVELWYGDVPVGRGHVPLTTPVTYGVDPFFIGEQRMTPVAPALAAIGPLPDGVLSHVVIEAEGKAYRDPAAEARAALALQ
jgi:arylsulfatase